MTQCISHVKGMNPTAFCRVAECRASISGAARSFASASPSLTVTKTKAKTKTAGGKARRSENIPDLKTFLHRTTVFSLYRDLLRLTGPRSPAPDMRDRVVSAFRVGKNWGMTDARVGMGLKEGKEARTFLSRGVGGWERAEEVASDDDADDDNDDAEVDGRVGVGWPWERKG